MNVESTGESMIMVTMLLLYLQALPELYEDLKENHDFESVDTRELQQDDIERFFAGIRMKGGPNTTLTQLDHQRCMRHAMLQAFLQKSAGNFIPLDLIIN